MSDNPFESSDLLLRDARRNIVVAAEELERFQKEDGAPESFCQEVQGSNIVELKLRFKNDIPLSLSLPIHHAIVSLRSALDHACFACGSLKFGPSATGRANFPIGRERAHVLSLLNNKRHQAIPQEIFDLIMHFRPHEDESGNLMLCAINAVRNTEVHEIVQRLAHSISAMQSAAQSNSARLLELAKDGPIEVASFEIEYFIPQIWDPKARELKIAWFDNQIIHEVEFKCSSYIGLGSVKFFGGEHPIRFLCLAHDMVHKIISDIVDKSIEIGLYKANPQRSD